MKKGLLMTLFGSFVFIYYLVLMIQSFYYEDDGYGKTLEFDQDLMVKMFVGLVLLICGIVVLIKVEKNQDTFKTYNTSINLVGIIMCIYPLGMMFKTIVKLNKHKATTNDVIGYLIWAIFGAFILAYGIISYIEHKKKNA